MKKRVFALILVALAAIALVGCGRTKTTVDVAFVTDIGQLMDKSFNQGTWEGVKAYAEANKLTYQYYQPANESAATDDDRYDAMKAAANAGAKIIVCAGYMQATALTKAAKEFTDVKFVFVDGWGLGLANVTAIIFQEEQAGYLAGYAAVMEGYTKLGFSGGGGGTNPACCRYGYGYIQGANAAAKSKNVQVSMKYSWLYGSNFQASQDLQSLLSGWYSTGTEVVFECGGSMFQSATAAASENSKKVIGVDVDQSGDSNTVITSAMKGLSAGTQYALKMFYTDKWSEISDKTINLGAKDDAVGLPTATWSLKNFTVAQYNTLFGQLKDGSVVVDAVVFDKDGKSIVETKTFSNLTLDYIK